MAGNRRSLFKNYIVDKEFQYAYIARNLFVLLSITISVLVLIFLWNHYKFKEGLMLRPPSGEQVIAWADQNNVKYDTAEFAYQYIVQSRVFTFFDLVWKPVVVVFFLNVIILTVTGLYFSYRIAGPIHHLKKVLKKIDEGETPSAIEFRKGDPFHELSDLANKALKLRPRPPAQPK